jgi:S-DNA-T family DNA segregation ATPase FtsK/SpoIIIE
VVEVPAAARGVGGRRNVQLLDVPRRPGLVQVAVVNAGRLAWWLLRVAAEHPALVAAGAGLWWALATLGPVRLAVAFGLCAAGCGAARWRWPERFERLLWCRLRAAWRRWWVYGRRWSHALTSCGLADDVGGDVWVPQLRGVRSTRWADVVRVRMLSGQDPAAWEQKAEALAHAFDATGCRVVVERPGRLLLHFTRRDPLTPVVPAVPVPDECDPAAVVAGVAEDPHGDGLVPWAVRLLGSHLLVAGATGSGKGSVLWSLVRGLLPGIRAGLVQVWAVDPKGGMELAPGAHLFARFAHTEPAAMLDLLEDAAALMRDRASWLRESGRRVLDPSPGEPLVVVVVDELAALVAYGGDRDTKKRAEHLLSLLLSQGRAPGVVVVAAVQDPGKDVVPFRDLFPQRVALRLVEETQVDMVLGRGYRDRGARADRIPTTLPGVGYVVLDGVREPVRVRAGHVTDTDLATMAGHAVTAAATSLADAAAAAALAATPAPALPSGSSSSSRRRVVVEDAA